jgi:putative ABC transport system permease protein
MAQALVFNRAFRQYFLIMLKNNFILAFRLLTRQRIYSAINLIGLSLGMASFLIIVLFYQYQMSYDQFHVKKDRIYRVNRLMDDKLRFSYVSSSLGESAQGHISGVKQTIRLSNMKLELQYGKNISSEFVTAADNTFFEIFNFNLLRGDPVTSLSDLNSIVLSEALSKKYFGGEPPIGKLISTTDRNGQIIDLRVTGVMQDIPANSHLMIDALCSYSTLKNFYSNEELNNNWSRCFTYLLLDQNANPVEVEKQLSDLVSHQIPLDNFKKASLQLQPLTEIYFNPTQNNSGQIGNKELTNIFLLIGIFILLIASLNYINLATARSLKRSKEVGIRKVSGANKKQLVLQFIGESVFFCVVSLLLALILVNLFIPIINDFSNFAYKIHLSPYFFLDLQFMGIALSAAIITGLVSGLYPAFVIFSFQPSKSLKGELVGSRKISTKKVLVVTQYVVSIFLVICCITIYKVFDHMRNQNFGFETENILAVNIDKLENSANIIDLKNKIERLDGVVRVAGASKIPLVHRDEISCYVYDNKINASRNNALIYIDEDYFELLEIEKLKKVHATENNGRAENGIYVNEVFMNIYGDQYSPGDPLEGFKTKKSDQLMFTSNINGVVENFKDRVLVTSLDPIILKIDQDKIKYLLLKLQPGTQHNTIAQIESTFKKQYAHLAFDFTFVDDEMNYIFSMITPFTRLIYYATFFAIFIASMGLFALSLFVTQQRTKEIGIRKIFGSSELNISLLLASQFIKLIVISFIIAAPLTFYGFRWILMKFPEKIELSWFLLIGAGIGFILIALLTVIGQSWKAAKTNPVETLRYE